MMGDAYGTFCHYGVGDFGALGMAKCANYCPQQTALLSLVIMSYLYIGKSTMRALSNSLCTA
jgi:hypothetical protein